MSWGDIHLDAKAVIASTSVSAWNALMRADPQFGRYALSAVGRSAFIATFTVVVDGDWTINNKFHRVATPGSATPDMSGSGGPACTYPSGGKEWYERGKPHRIGGPACIYADGSEEWYENGEPHRIGGPAFKYRIGGEEWWERGKLHRIGGPARTCRGGGEEWYEHGKLHRICIPGSDGPAHTIRRY